MNYLHVFDRSKLDEVSCVYPKGHPKFPEGRSVTMREDLTENQYMFRRRDVILMNGTRSGREYIVEVTPTGFAGAVWLLDVISDADYNRLLAFAEKMRQNAKDFPPSAALLRESDR